MTRRKKHTDGPSRDAVAEFIRNSPSSLSKRQIATALHVGAAGRSELNAVLDELERDGVIGRTHRRYDGGGALPQVAVLEVTAIDSDGEPLLQPVSWRGEGPPPLIYLMPDRRGRAPALGDRVLARLRRLEQGHYEARTMRRLPAQPRRVLGRFTTVRDGGQVRPADRRIKTEFVIGAADTAGAADGELVLCEVLSGRMMGLPQARVAERLGPEDAPGAASLIAIHGRGIPTEFSPAALDEAAAAAAAPAPGAGREDLCHAPLITIDDEDARDFDDAVWAEPDDDPANQGGWHLVIAIADVAWYVRPDSALDMCAHDRGNSAYFPDRVVPMLPEALSNDLCSLRPGEDRPCFAVHVWIDGAGRKRRHYFVRAMMRSAARLTYRQVQDARDAGDERNGPDGAAAPDIPPGVIAPLYGAFEALRRARHSRGTIDLELAERRVVMDEAGRVQRVEGRQRLDSHRLIEEFMIAANVCAAETLESARHPCMYRAHDEPPPDKLLALRQFLQSLGFRLAGGQAVRPRHFAQTLASVADTPHAHAVNEAILRAQSQAVYSPENPGHFGLALRRYCHFTSPIRRYADLIVHRALITALNLGAGGLGTDAGNDFAALGEHVSMTERRATAAERETLDRLMAGYLSDRIGAEFDGRINGVERFGLFVTLEETGGDGLLPASALGDDNYRLDTVRHMLVGRHGGEEFRLGDAIRVRLAEADRLTGGLVFVRPDGPPLARRADPPRRIKGAGAQRHRRRPTKGRRSGR